MRVICFVSRHVLIGLPRSLSTLWFIPASTTSLPGTIFAITDVPYRVSLAERFLLFALCTRSPFESRIGLFTDKHHYLPLADQLATKIECLVRILCQRLDNRKQCSPRWHNTRRKSLCLLAMRKTFTTAGINYWAKIHYRLDLCEF